MAKVSILVVAAFVSAAAVTGLILATGAALLITTAIKDIGFDHRIDELTVGASQRLSSAQTNGLASVAAAAASMSALAEPLRLLELVNFGLLHPSIAAPNTLHSMCLDTLFAKLQTEFYKFSTLLDGAVFGQDLVVSYTGSKCTGLGSTVRFVLFKTTTETLSSAQNRLLPIAIVRPTVDPTSATVTLHMYYFCTNRFDDGFEYRSDVAYADPGRCAIEQPPALAPNWLTFVHASGDTCATSTTGRQLCAFQIGGSGAFIQVLTNTGLMPDSCFATFTDCAAPFQGISTCLNGAPGCFGVTATSLGFQLVVGGAGWVYEVQRTSDGAPWVSLLLHSPPISAYDFYTSVPAGYLLDSSVFENDLVSTITVGEQDAASFPLLAMTPQYSIGIYAQGM